MRVLQGIKTKTRPALVAGRTSTKCMCCGNEITEEWTANKIHLRRFCSEDCMKEYLY